MIPGKNSADHHATDSRRELEPFHSDANQNGARVAAASIGCSALTAPGGGVPVVGSSVVQWAEPQHTHNDPSAHRDADDNCTLRDLQHPLRPLNDRDVFSDERMCKKLGRMVSSREII